MMGDMLDSEEFADCTIISGDEKESKCHKVFLSSFSPVFKVMLTSDLKRAEGTQDILKLEEMSYEGVQLMLHFCYSGELFMCLPNPEFGWFGKFPHYTLEAYVDAILEALIAADKYEIKTLEDAAVPFLEIFNIMFFYCSNGHQTIAFCNRTGKFKDLRQKALDVLRL